MDNSLSHLDMRLGDVRGEGGGNKAQYILEIGAVRR